jgi:hypothetical protein
MVVCSATQLKEVYQDILSRTAKKSGIVVIFTCYDLDSICAAKILTVSLFELSETADDRCCEIQTDACHGIYRS